MENVTAMLEETKETQDGSAPQLGGALDPAKQPDEQESLAAEPAEREARLADLEAQLAQERLAAQQAQAEALRLRQELTLALEKFRAALLSSAPEVPEELVQGETVAELTGAFERVRALVERLRRQLEATARKERVPAGAPERRAPDLSTLTPHQKIVLGMQRRAG